MQSPPNFDQKSMQQNLLDDLKTQLLAENFTDQKQKDYDNRTAKLIDDAKNSSLLIVIFVTNIMLQNSSIKNIILSKFSRFENPYLNLATISRSSCSRFPIQELLLTTFNKLFIYSL